MPKRFLFNLRGNDLQAAQVWAIIFPAYVLFGWSSGVAGPLLTLPSWVQTFPSLDTINTTGAQNKHNSTLQGTVVALYTLGAFFGSLACIWLGDRLGRLRTIALGSIVNTVGVIIQVSSFSLAQLIVGRLVAGMGFGALSATAPNWQGECSKASHRGTLVILESLFTSAGLALSAWVDLGMSFVHSSASWRFPLAVPGFLSLIVIVLIPTMPESPRWLILKGRYDEAREVLSTLDDVPVDDPSVDANVSEITESIARAGDARFAHLLKNGELRLFNRTCLAVLGQAFQQLSGVNVIGIYQQAIYQQHLGFSSTISRILTGSQLTFQTLCSPIGVLTVDRFGRRKLMLVSAIGMGVCMAVVAGTIKETTSKACQGVATAFIFLFSAFFPVGFQSTTFLYATEISPLTYRVPMTAISTGGVWIFSFLVAEVTPTAFSTISWKYFIVWACTNLLLTLPVIYFLFPETCGRHLEEMDLIFSYSNNIFEPVRMARKIPVNVPHQEADIEDEKQMEKPHHTTIEDVSTKP